MFQVLPFLCYGSLGFVVVELKVINQCNSHICLTFSDGSGPGIIQFWIPGTVDIKFKINTNRVTVLFQVPFHDLSIGGQGLFLSVEPFKL